jgi:hypothetical protein
MRIERIRPRKQMGSGEKEHVRRGGKTVEAVQFALAVEDVRPQFERRKKADDAFELVLFVRLDAQPRLVVRRAPRSTKRRSIGSRSRGPSHSENTR